MPVDYSTYHPEWFTRIRPAILERAGEKCESCGVENGRHIVRSSENPERYLYFDFSVEYTYTYPNGRWIKLSEVPEEYSGDPIKVVLTVAHLDHDKGNNAYENLRAWCQRCHLNYDRAHVNQIKRVNRIHCRHLERLEAGQRALNGFDL